MIHQRPPSHDRLLAMASRLATIARDDDPSRLEAGSLRLFEALAAHLDDERVDLVRLPPGANRILTRGQRRLTELAIEVTLAFRRPTAHRCADLAEELLARLTLQADDVRGVLPASHLPPDWGQPLLPTLTVGSGELSCPSSNLMAKQPPLERAAYTPSTAAGPPKSPTGDQGRNTMTTTVRTSNSESTLGPEARRRGHEDHHDPARSATDPSRPAPAGRATLHPDGVEGTHVSTPDTTLDKHAAPAEARRAVEPTDQPALPSDETPILTAADSDPSTSGRRVEDGLDELVHDHSQVRALLDQLTKPSASPKAILTQLINVVSVHTDTETRGLGPTIRARCLNGRRIARESRQQGRTLDQLLAKIERRSISSSDLAQLIDKAASAVVDRMDDEEAVIFPQIRAALTQSEIASVDHRLSTSRHTATTRPHPYLPHRGPLGHLARSTMSLMDHWRDRFAPRL